MVERPLCNLIAYLSSRVELSLSEDDDGEQILPSLMGGGNGYIMASTLRYVCHF
jgi:hypothetical protein